MKEDSAGRVQDGLTTGRRHMCESSNAQRVRSSTAHVSPGGDDCYYTVYSRVHAAVLAEAVTPVTATRFYYWQPAGYTYPTYAGRGYGRRATATAGESTSHAAAIVKAPGLVATGSLAWSPRSKPAEPG